ncbi:MAG: UPF0175 family protein [Verrucomicrobiaceae bacterium]|nr:UPF0175 family protein [Verrucomicrobiaceae bacterium]
MLITLDIPDELSVAACGDPAKIAMEALAARAYEAGSLSEEQVRRVLRLDSCWEAREVLSRYRVWPSNSVEDVMGDMDALQSLRSARL